MKVLRNSRARVCVSSSFFSAANYYFHHCMVPVMEALLYRVE